MFITKALKALYKHSRPWLQHLLPCAVADDPAFAQPLARLLFSIVEEKPHAERAALIDTFRGTTVVVTHGQQQKVTTAPSARHHYDVGTLLEAATELVEKDGGREILLERGVFFGTASRAAAERSTGTAVTTPLDLAVPNIVATTAPGAAPVAAPSAAATDGAVDATALIVDLRAWAHGAEGKMPPALLQKVLKVLPPNQGQITERQVQVISQITKISPKRSHERSSGTASIRTNYTLPERNVVKANIAANSAGRKRHGNQYAESGALDEEGERPRRDNAAPSATQTSGTVAATVDNNSKEMMYGMLTQIKLRSDALDLPMARELQKQRKAMNHQPLRDAKKVKTLNELRVVQARTQTSTRATTADVVAKDYSSNPEVPDHVTHLGTVAVSSLTIADLEAELAARPVPAFAFDGTAGAGSRKQQLQQALADAVRGADAGGADNVLATRVERFVDEDDGVVTSPLGVTMRRPGDDALPPASEPTAAMLVRLGVRSAATAAAPSAPAAPSPPPPPEAAAAAAAPTAEEETAAEQDGGGDVIMGAAPPPPQTEEAEEDPILAPPRVQHAQRERRGGTVANYATLSKDD